MRISDWSSDVCSSDLAVDDEGVRRGDVEAAFDDGRRKEHIIFAVVEGRHALLDLGGRHLTVGADEGDFGYLVAEELLDVRKVGDARGDEIDLAAAIIFAEPRLADTPRTTGHDKTPD